MESAKKKNAPKRFGCVKIGLISMGLLLFLCGSMTFVWYYEDITHDDFLNRNGLKSEVAVQNFLAEQLPLSETSIEAVRSYMADEGIECYTDEVDNRNSRIHHISCMIPATNPAFNKAGDNLLISVIESVFYHISYHPRLFIHYKFSNGTLIEIKTSLFYPYL